MKQIILSIAILFTGVSAFSQAEDYFTPAKDSSYDFSLHEEEEDKLNDKDNRLSQGKTTLHPMLQVGSSVYSAGNAPHFSSYVAPSLRVDPPGKLSLSFGTSMIYSDFMTSTLPESQGDSYFEKMATYQLYASGSYQVNKNLNIRGGASLTLLPTKDNETLKRGHIGFDYSISDNAFIQADFNFGNAMPYYGPFGYSPYNMNSNMSIHGSSHGRSPFMY
ncbi:MAG: hypothetical protein R6V32_11730 [Bacteroidales bacterium]